MGPPTNIEVWKKI